MGFTDLLNFIAAAFFLSFVGKRGGWCTTEDGYIGRPKGKHLSIFLGVKLSWGGLTDHSSA